MRARIDTVSHIRIDMGTILVYTQCAGGYIQGEHPWRGYIPGEKPYQSGYGIRYQYGHAYVHVNFSFFEKFGVLKILCFWGVGGGWRQRYLGKYAHNPGCIVDGRHKG